MSSKILKLGIKNSVSYNIATERINPSHMKFVSITLILIVVPSITSFFLIITNAELSLV